MTLFKYKYLYITDCVLLRTYNYLLIKKLIIFFFKKRKHKINIRECLILVKIYF